MPSDYRDEVALAVLLETLRNTVTTAKIASAAKAREMQTADALAAYAYELADSMIKARGLTLG